MKLIPRKALVLLAMALFILLAHGIVLAATLHQASPAAAAPVAAATLQLPGLPPINLGSSWWAGLLMGGFASIQAIFIGWLKSRDAVTGKLAPFDWTMAAETVGVGLLIGLVAHFIHWAPQDLASWLQVTPMGGMIITGVESLLNMVFRHGIPALKGAITLYQSSSTSTTQNPPPPATK